MHTPCLKNANITPSPGPSPDKAKTISKSSKTLKTHWFLNIFGQSAAEVGTIHRKGDLLLELPQNGENSLVFHMADVNDGSWMVLKITIHENQKVAQVEFLWFTQNVVYQIAQASKSCHVEKTQPPDKFQTRPFG